jgi:hypothetical protein
MEPERFLLESFLIGPNVALNQKSSWPNSELRSAMKRNIGIVLIVSLLLIGVFFQLPQLAVGQVFAPFDGLQLVYFSETTPALQQATGLAANSTITLVFHNVTAANSFLEIDTNGTYVENGQQHPENFSTLINFPMNQDTLIFLRNGGQSNLTIFAGPTQVAIPSIPGLKVDLTRTWTLYDKPYVKTPFGSFNAYRYHTAIKSIPMQNGGTVNLDFYASYDQVTQVLLSGEAWATVSGFSAMIAHTDIVSTNLFSGPGQSSGTPGTPRCLIATATYGSELAPPVQFLRQFRDYKIDRTFAGVNFMVAFNLWYYSFSPTVASMITSNPEFQSIMRVLLFPLVMILEFSSSLFGALSVQPEFAALITGLVSSAMIGILYLGIPSFLLLRRYKHGVRRVMNVLLGTLGIGIFGLAVSELYANTPLAILSTATIALANLFLFAGLPCVFLGRDSISRWVNRNLSVRF